jgi:hypothetical protein
LVTRGVYDVAQGLLKYTKCDTDSESGNPDFMVFVGNEGFEHETVETLISRKFDMVMRKTVEYKQ